MNFYAVSLCQYFIGLSRCTFRAINHSILDSTLSLSAGFHVFVQNGSSYFNIKFEAGETQFFRLFHDALKTRSK